MEQVRVIHTCLDLFYKSSGEKINKEKIHMLCSRNIHTNVASKLSWESGYTLVPDLGKYLGISLHHSRVNRSSYQFLVDKMQRSLSKWKVNFLSLTGRITLAKSILNTIPVYYMQTNIIPNSVCESIDKITRHFMGDSREDKKGSHLIAWNDLCNHRYRGEVGLRKTKTMNQALLIKLG